MATKWTSPTWRMPEESNQSKFENYSLDFGPGTINYSTPVDLGVVSTFSFWMNIDTGTTGALFGNTLLGTYEYVVYYSGSGFFFKIAGAYADFPNAAAAISTGQWHHVTFVRPSENEVKCYIDSVLTDTITSWNGTPGSNPIKFDLIGSRPGGGLPYSGKIGQIAGFDHALTDGTGGTENQIGNLYNSGTPVNPMALTPIPTAYYPLGGGSTGDADDPATTLTVPNESVPSATVFDFTSNLQYIKASNFGSVFSGKTAFSFSGWFKLSTLNTFQQIFNIYDGSDNYFGINTFGNQLRFNIDYANSTAFAYVNQAQLLTGTDTWFHYAGYFDGSQAASADRVKVYINGTPTTLTFSGTPPTSFGTIPATADTQIGGQVSGFNGFQPTGSASNIQLWDTNLSPSEITTLYNNGVPYTGTQPQAANLKAWYKMNVDTSTWNGTDWLLSNSSITPTYTEGLFFGGSYIGGSPVANYAGMRLTNQTISSDHVTHSFWYKRVLPTTGSSDDIVVPGSGVHLGTVNVISSGTVQWVGDGASKYINFSGNVADGAWHHVLVYYPNGTTITHADIECYIDGTLQTNSYIGGSSSAGPVTQIKGTLLASVPIQVELSNWAYFLTDQTGNINTIYNGGTPGDISSLSPSVWLKYDSATTAFAGATGANYGLATDSSGNSNNGNLAGRTDGTTTKLVTSNVQSGDGISNGMTTANLVNSDLTRSIPYSSYSMVFDGLDDYISFPADASLNISTANHSMSFWLKTTDSGICVVSQKAQDELATWIQSSKIKWAAENPFSSTSNINDGTWKHICFVADGSSSYIYINGVLDATGGSQIRSSASGSAFAIGSRPGSFPYDGSISNWGLFNKALTEDQILTIYNGGVPNSISSLSPVSWWSLAGDSYFDGNDFICPDLGSGGNNGTSSGMGGAELVGNGPGSTANGTATSMDIPANLKGNAPNSSKNAFSVNMTEIDRVSGAGNVPG